jgi:hypothetical protein
MVGLFITDFMLLQPSHDQRLANKQLLFKRIEDSVSFVLSISMVFLKALFLVLFFSSCTRFLLAQSFIKHLQNITSM